MANLKVYFELRKSTIPTYYIDYRVIKIKDYYVTEFKSQDDTRWTRRYAHRSLDKAIERINR